jgi:hypothetical protein
VRGLATRKKANSSDVASSLEIPIKIVSSPLPSFQFTTKHMSKLIAFAGYAGAGKDEAAVPLIQRGYVRRAFGDIIKGQIDSLVHQHFGFSAFTSDRAEKAKIRRTLESWGEDNYDAIMEEFFLTLPAMAVNTRLVRSREGMEWKRRGGIIVHIVRDGCNGATRWEQQQLVELSMDCSFDHVIKNNGTIAELHAKVCTLL